MEYNQVEGGVIVGIRLFCRFVLDRRWGVQCDEFNEAERDGEWSFR